MIEDSYSRGDHILLFRNTDLWPNWPYLPVYDPLRDQHGVIMDLAPSAIIQPYRKLTRVWLVHHSEVEGVRSWPSRQYEDFASAGAIWDAGWRGGSGQE